MAEDVLFERGLFWFHSEPIPAGHITPGNCVPGTLTISGDGAIRLDLDEILTGDGDPFRPLVNRGVKSPEDVAIQGKLKGNGRRALLLGLRGDGGSFGVGMVAHERYTVDRCLLTQGTFPADLGDLKFAGIEVDLSGFEDWVWVQGGTIEYARNEETYTVTHSKEPDATYSLPDGDVAIEFGLGAPSAPLDGECRRTGEITLEEYATWCFRPAERLSAESMIDEYGKIQELLILLSGSSFALAWPTLTIGNTRYEVFFRKHKGSAQPARWDECWARFCDIRADFGDVVANWRRRRDELGPGAYLYLGLKRGMTLYAEHQFVSLVSGLEALHRKNSAVESPEAAAVRERIARILSNITDEPDREWLEKRLRNAAEPNLEQRLYSVFSALPLGLTSKKLRAFCTKCAARRNDIAHFGGQRAAGSYKDFILQVALLSQALDILYRAVLLHDIGVPADQILSQVTDGPHSIGARMALHSAGLVPDPKRELTRRTGSS